MNFLAVQFISGQQFGGIWLNHCKLINIPFIAQDLWWKAPNINGHWPGNDQSDFGERMLF